MVDLFGAVSIDGKLAARRQSSSRSSPMPEETDDTSLRRTYALREASAQRDGQRSRSTGTPATTCMHSVVNYVRPRSAVFRGKVGKNGYCRR
jgi:hypothetical protein